MGMPLLWHKRHALLIASQLPDDPADAQMVLQALTDLMGTFLVDTQAQAAATVTGVLASNVLPFAIG
jgi:hypothetical protein